MRAFLAALAIAAALVPTAGCLRSTTFTCSSDPDCSTGQCEINGYCSFADTTCPSGRRYGDLSGPVANSCVGEEPPDVDGPPGNIDAPPGNIDAPPGLCPAAYVPVGGAPNVYHLLTASEIWVDQQVACADEGGYLVIPGDQNELDAMTGLAGAAIWIGIHDRGPEGVYVDVRGGTPGFLPWAANQPDDDPPGEDCVLATGSTISDERCGAVSAPAVCECEP